MVNERFKSFRMGFNYKLAEEIISCFNLADPSEFLNNLTSLECSDCEGVIQEIFKENIDAILKPKKYTLLHTFCELYLYYYLNEERWFVLHVLVGDHETGLVIDHIKSTVDILNEYGVVLGDYSTEINMFIDKYEASDYELNNEYKELISGIFDEVFAFFNKIKESIIEATFYLLYDNKEFLYKFNKYLSQFTTASFLPESCFAENNHIKRTIYMPAWLKRAVFYRDRGRCQHCGKDLSGQLLIAEDGEIQFDHIIPLENGGTNDATNFQLLCYKCNLKKGGQLYYPNYFYQMYW